MISMNSRAASSAHASVASRLKPRSEAGDKSGLQPIPTVTLLSLPDELLSRIFGLVHAGYQRDKPGMPPIGALLISKRITAIANRIWMRVLVAPSDFYHYRNDAYFAGVLSRSDTSVYTQEIDLSLGGIYFHLPMAVVARLFASRKLAVHYPSGQAIVPSIRAAWGDLVEHLPALTDLELPMIDEPLGRVISAVAKERSLCLHGAWHAYDPALRLSNVTGHVVRGPASPCRFAWTSAKRIELSSESFESHAAWTIIGDLEILVGRSLALSFCLRCLADRQMTAAMQEEQAAPLPLEILKLDLDNVAKPVEYIANLMGWFCIRLFDCLRWARALHLPSSIQQSSSVDALGHDPPRRKVLRAVAQRTCPFAGLRCSAVGPLADIAILRSPPSRRFAVCSSRSRTSTRSRSTRYVTTPLRRVQLRPSRTEPASHN